MTQIQFYHLSSTPIERACPRLVEKAHEAGYRVHLVLPSEEQVQYFNDALWSFAQLSFLPHGTKDDPNPARQPVFLSAPGEDAPNNPDLLFITDGSTPPEPARYKRVLDLFDGNNPDSVQAARARWKRYKERAAQTGDELSYFRQTEKGGWEKAA